MGAGRWVDRTPLDSSNQTNDPGPLDDDAIMNALDAEGDLDRETPTNGTSGSTPNECMGMGVKCG